MAYIDDASQNTARTHSGRAASRSGPSKYNLFSPECFLPETTSWALRRYINSLEAVPFRIALVRFSRIYSTILYTRITTFLGTQGEDHVCHSFGNKR